MRRFQIAVVLLVSFSFFAEAKRRPATMLPAGPMPLAKPIHSDNPLLLKIYTWEEQRTVDMALLNALQHPSSRIRRAAILALGRIGEPSTIAELANLMNRRRYPDKQLVAFSLGLFPDEVATTVLVQHLAMQKDPAILREIYLSLGRQGTEKHLQAVTKPIRDGGPAPLLEASCLALGMLWSRSTEDWKTPDNLLPQLVRALSSRQAYAIPCAFAISRFKGDEKSVPTASLIQAAQQNGSLDVKSYTARALGRSHSKEATDTLLNWAAGSGDTSLRIEAVKALSSHPYTEAMREALSKNLGEKKSALLVQTLTTIGAHGLTAQDLAPRVDALITENRSVWVRSHALRALGEISPLTSKKRMEEILTMGSPELLPAAVSLLASSATPEENSRITAFLQHDNPRVVVEMVDALGTKYDEDWPTEWKNAFKKSVERGDPAICSAASQLVTRLQWKDLAPSLATALTKLNQNDQVESKIAVLSAIGAVGSSTQVPLLQTSLTDSQKSVSQAAADALKSITGQDFSQKVPSNSRFATPSFQMDEIEKAIEADVVIRTTRGDITLQMVEEAPLTALNFTRLAKRKFYDGLTFHRVVPHFVAQGGDPRGDGYGGSGYLVRDEFGHAPQTRGTVGLATAGRDTGGSQFYINLGPNRHLDGRYTLFARVTSGIDVADRLEEGDRILSVLVR